MFLHFFLLKMLFLHKNVIFFVKSFAHIKKMRYLCTCKVHAGVSARKALAFEGGVCGHKMAFNALCFGQSESGKFQSIQDIAALDVHGICFSFRTCVFTRVRV